MAMYKRLVLAYDGSESGQKALLDCRDIAQWTHAALYLVAVMPAMVPAFAVEGIFPDPEAQHELERKYANTLAEGLSRLAGAGCAAKGEVLTGEPVFEICAFAQRVGADLIVVGHRHREGWAARWWRGSTSGSLVEHAPCSVLVAITR
jgi:nucleotide-binding universal stress UspA family protein